MIIDSMQRYCNQEQISRLIVFADQYRFKKSISVKEFYKEVFDKLSKEKYEYDPENLFGRVSVDWYILISLMLMIEWFLFILALFNSFCLI